MAKIDRAGNQKLRCDQCSLNRDKGRDDDTAQHGPSYLEGGLQDTNELQLTLANM